ncbi:MAG: hypothetical protein WEE89_09285 [Gemmatimonadota bacterium]
MNVEELLNADRELTVEEMEFLEQQALALAKELEKVMQELAAGVEEQDPEMAAELKRPARKMVKALEAAAAIPFEEPKPVTRFRNLVRSGDIEGALDSLSEEP